MPFGGLLSVAGPLIGIGSSIAGLAGGSPASNVQLPQGYQYGNLPGADTGVMSGIGGLSNYNVPAQLLPQYQNIAQNMVSNPYANMYQQGAGTAGQMGMGAGANAYGAGGALQQGGLNTLPDVQALLTLGFDPQNALYMQKQQQNIDQTNAINSMYGVGGTPYGAGLANQSNINFNLGWENQALQRAMTGAQGAGALLGNAGGALTTGAGLQGGGANTFLQGAGTPYGTFQGINANALNTLGQAGAFGTSASVLPQQQIQDYLAYLAQGTQQQQANTNLANTGLNQANLAFNQSNMTGQNLGSSLAGLARAYNTGWGSGGGGSNWYGTAGGTGGGLGGLY